MLDAVADAVFDVTFEDYLADYFFKAPVKIVGVHALTHWVTHPIE